MCYPPPPLPPTFSARALLTRAFALSLLSLGTQKGLRKKKPSVPKSDPLRHRKTLSPLMQPSFVGLGQAEGCAWDHLDLGFE